MRATHPPANLMPAKASRSIHAVPSGDWLVVIDRREASVFRSTAPGAASQCIRAHLPIGGAGMRPAPRDQPSGRERSRCPGYFEPLAGVLHGARRILVFGRVTPFGDETGSFVFWLCNRHPDLAARIVASVAIQSDEIDESRLLAKAHAFYERPAPIGPPVPGRRTER